MSGNKKICGGKQHVITDTLGLPGGGGSTSGYSTPSTSSEGRVNYEKTALGAEAAVIWQNCQLVLNKS